MVSFSTVLCKTAGVVGMGVALYDTAQSAKTISRRTAHAQTAKWMENSYYNARTIDNISTTSNSIRAKTFDIKTRSPIPSVFGKIKGGFQGTLYGLGVNLPAIAFSTLAITTKGIWSKIGAVGVACGLLYNIARNGFGLGKQHPMN